MKYQSKADLISDIHAQHDLLCARLDELPKSRCREPGVGDGWTVTDLVAHLSEWQLMFLRWYEDGLRGAAPKDAVPGLQMERDAKAEPGHLGETSVSIGGSDQGRLRHRFQSDSQNCRSSVA